MTCSADEQDEGDPVVYSNGFVLPKMASPMVDLNPDDLQFYVAMIGGSDATEFVENTTASNVGWDSLDTIVEAGDELADFAEYARRSVYPLAMPDVCKAFCPDVVDSVATAAKATEDFCATPGLDLLSACVFAQAESMPACGISPLAVSLQECADSATSATRRLSGSDESNEEDDFENEEEEDEDNMKVTTIASGALKQAAVPQPTMPVLSKLGDGTNSLDIADLDDE